MHVSDGDIGRTLIGSAGLQRDPCSLWFSYPLMGAEEKRHPCRDRNRERSTLPWGKGWLLSGPKITTKPWWRGNFLASGTIFQGCDREDFTGWDFSSIKPDAKLCPTGEGERGRCTPDDDANKYLVRWSYGLPVNNLCLPSPWISLFVPAENNSKDFML
jgi:hypothetical protein